MRAAIYARQSLSSAEGIERQIARCTSLIDARDWTLARTLIDNDVSASKPRGEGTAWHTLLNAKDIDVVVAVNLDRLIRRQNDLTALIESGLKATTLEGELDLASASGEMQASVLTAMARFETRRKGERQVRANQHRRDNGLPTGNRRSFGYTKLTATSGYGTRVGKDGKTYPAFGHQPHPVEAPALLRGYALLLSGHSLRAIARDWNRAGLFTTSKKPAPWTASSVRTTLLNPRNAGLLAPPRSVGTPSVRHYLSLSDLPKGKWEAIVDDETYNAAKDMLADASRRSNVGAPALTLLSGIARCAVCGTTVQAGSAGRGEHTYKCAASSHMSRKREAADEFVSHVILDRLARPDAAQALLARPDAPDVDKVKSDLRAARQAEQNVLDLVRDGLTTMPKAVATLKDIRERVGELDAQLEAVGRTSEALSWLTEVGGKDYDERWRAVAALWEGASIERRRAVVRELLDIVMAAPKQGSRPPKDTAGRLAHTEASMTLVWR